MIYRLATLNETPAITDLINRCYPGESSRYGWTPYTDELELIVLENKLFPLPKTATMSLC